MKESQNIEFKGEWRDEYLKWICGFANAQGGKIYIGFDDNGVLNDSADVLLEDLQLLENGFLKRAAILLFYSKPEKFVAGAYIKIGFFKTDDDLIFQDEVHGSLMEQIDKTEDLLKTKYAVYTIDYEGMARVEKPPFPEKAIREALLNAIAHKDYSDPTPIQISVYSNHIVFWNPGQLPENWTVETLKIKHASKPFNPSIANTLFRCGDIEAWGRGTLKMINEAVLNKSLPPEFSTSSAEFSITFFKDVKTAMMKKNINPDFAPIVEYVIEKGEITNSDVKRILNVSKASATRFLKVLESSFLSRLGETGVGTIYILKGSQRAHNKS